LHFLDRFQGKVGNQISLSSNFGVIWGFNEVGRKDVEAKMGDDGRVGELGSVADQLHTDFLSLVTLFSRRFLALVTINSIIILGRDLFYLRTS
jgi:hypothetical protein